MPMVSVITPVYNAARWLPETLASVRAQTLQDWEHLLVDDGSSDDSVAIIEALAEDDSRVRLLRTPVNSGPAAARNIAIGAACGRYLAFLDADDIWLPEKLALMTKWMLRHNYAFAYHDYRNMSHDGSRTGALICGPDVLDFETVHTRRGMGSCVTVVIDRSLVGGFRFPCTFSGLHEDLCGWIELVKGGHVGHRLPMDLARYRLTPHSRNANKAVSVLHTWSVYRQFSGLSWWRSSWWWLVYVLGAIRQYGSSLPATVHTSADGVARSAHHSSHV